MTSGDGSAVTGARAGSGASVSSPLTIRDARVIVTCPGRNFVTLKIETDQGVYGIGDATLNGREKAVVAYLEDHVCPLLIGRDARRIEDTWQLRYRGCLLYTSPSPRDRTRSRMPSSA